MKRAFSLLALLLTVATLFVSPSAKALSGSSFSAGRIIDDAVFYNYNSMNVGQIQNFLNSKVVCDTWGVQQSELGGGTRAQYGAAHNNPAPFTCLNQYYENTTTLENNLDGRAVPAGAISAAQIIWNAAQTYQINPQVLIVLLQKEQGLVTDEWPFDVQYRSATGYGCPDTAPCNTQYYGFYNQVTDAAWQFRQYATNPNSFNFVANQFNNIPWSPTSSCGSGRVFIENQATAGLYDYTPYQPNAAALNNLYGSGDSCSAYGNRNFWRYFNDWFGATTGVRFAAVYNGQSQYPTVQAGASSQAWFFFKNVGNSTWVDDTGSAADGGGLPPIHLAATNPINRADPFSASWPSASRAATNFTAVYESDGVTLAANQHQAAPGQMIVFSFNFNVPANTPPGVYREWFQPVAEGVPDWYMGSVGYLDVTVTPAAHRAAFYRMSQYPVMERGSSAAVYIDYKNVGSDAWYDDTSVPAGQHPIHLASTSPINRSSQLVGSDMASASRPAVNFAAVYESDDVTLAANQHVVNPGQIGRFAWHYAALPWYPSGTYREWIQPVVEGDSLWDMGALGYFDATVTGQDWKAKFVGFSGYPTVTRGSSTSVYIDYQNIGTQTWYDSTINQVGAINLANTNPINRSNSLMYDTGWTSTSRPQTAFSAVYEMDHTTLAADQHRAVPGQIIRFSYKYNVPSGMPTGVWQEWIQPVREWMYNWDIGALGYFQVTVQ